MDYHLLTASDQLDLVRERVLFLESEHYRLMLRRAEAVSQAELDGLDDQAAELARRIGIHAPPAEEPPADPDGEPDDESDTAGRGEPETRGDSLDDADGHSL